MTDDATESTTQLPLRVPTAVVRMSLVGPGGGEHMLPDAISGLLLGHTGVHRLDSGLFIVVPAAGDEAVFDAAVVWARTLGEAWIEAGATSGEQGLSTLIFPGVAVLEGSTARLLDDFLLDDIRRQSPDLGPGIYVTGRAATMLEYPPVLTPAQEYEGPSGKAVSLMRLGELRLDQLPWRNPEVFGRATRYVSRPRHEESLGGLLAESVTRVSGPLGCGKTRLVWEHLAAAGFLRLWLRVRPERTPTPSLAEQVIYHLLLPSERQQGDPLHPKLAGRVDRVKVREALSGKRAGDGKKLQELLDERALAALDHLGASQTETVFLVVDDLHRATPGDAAFISSLLSSRHLGLRFRVVLVGRSGIAWPRELEPFPVLDVPPLTAEEMAELTGQITEGLSIPQALKGRFINAVQGYPFAFEEGLFALIHEKYLRRVYGNFFFGGDETTQFQPSHRFVRHVEAEVGRLGSPLPVRLLSLVDTSVPASELAAASSLFGERLEPGWEQTFLDARILRREESPWGVGLRIVSPVNSRALAHGLPEESALLARHQLGELLALSGQSGDAHWHSYRLLAGTPEALEPLMQLFKTSYTAQIPREELLEALTQELRLIRSRENDEQAELQLLWRLLPLARRMGCLNRYEEDLAHGIELARPQPRRLLALATIKAELEQEAGKYSHAEVTIKDALKAAADIDARKKALLMIQLGQLFLRQNRFSEAEQMFSNLQQAFREVGSSALAATCLFYRGNIALRNGRLEQAFTFHQEALEERRRQNLVHPVGISLSALGTVAMTAGNYPQALDYYHQAREALEEHGREGEVAFALLGVARTLSRIGDFTGATGPVRRALELRQGRDDSIGEAIARLAVARNYLDIDRPDAALEEARKAHFQLSMVSADAALAEADELLGRIHYSQRRLDDARRRLESALKRYKAQQDSHSAAFVIGTLIEVCISQEDADGIRKSTTELKNLLQDSPPADLGEVLHFQLFRGLDWLTNHGHKVGNPTSFLEKAYGSVLRKAGHLDQDIRQRYLFQVDEIRAIVEAATRLGLDETAGENEDIPAPSTSEE